LHLNGTFLVNKRINKWSLSQNTILPNERSTLHSSSLKEDPHSTHRWCHFGWWWRFVPLFFGCGLSSNAHVISYWTWSHEQNKTKLNKRN
jgi:hypothetical protein